MDDPAVKVTNVSKLFKLPHENRGSVKSAFVNIFRGGLSYERQLVLDDISFEIEKGDFFGIVGRNGSGKSTLLKLLAGIYEPSKGQVHVNGSLTPFIELGVGFNPELTGRENVFLNGALLGFSRKDMRAMYNDIVEFAELDKFMDQKLKNYSSGMQVRLAFSIAIRAQSDILLIDEVLAVGDSAFQQKCFSYFEQLKREKRTVILVTHDMMAAERFCNKAMLINSGKIVYLGDPREAATRYSILNQAAATKSKKKGISQLGELASITRVSSPQDSKTITMGGKLDVVVDIEIKKQIEAIVGLYLLRQDSVYIAGRNNFKEKKLLKKGRHTVACQLDLKDLLPGRYVVNVSLLSEPPELSGPLQPLDVKSGVLWFTIQDIEDRSKDGIIDIPSVWRYGR